MVTFGQGSDDDSQTSDPGADQPDSGGSSGGSSTGGSPSFDPRPPSRQDRSPDDDRDQTDAGSRQPSGGSSGGGGGGGGSTRTRTETVEGTSTVGDVSQRQRDLTRGAGPTVESVSEERTDLASDAIPATAEQREAIAAETDLETGDVAGIDPTTESVVVTDDARRQQVADNVSRDPRRLTAGTERIPLGTDPEAEDVTFDADGARFTEDFAREVAFERMSDEEIERRAREDLAADSPGMEADDFVADVDGQNVEVRERQQPLFEDQREALGIPTAEEGDVPLEAFEDVPAAVANPIGAASARGLTAAPLPGFVTDRTGDPEDIAGDRADLFDRSMAESFEDAGAVTADGDQVTFRGGLESGEQAFSETFVQPAADGLEDAAETQREAAEAAPTIVPALPPAAVGGGVEMGGEFVNPFSTARLGLAVGEASLDQAQARQTDQAEAIAGIDTDTITDPSAAAETAVTAFAPEAVDGTRAAGESQQTAARVGAVGSEAIEAARADPVRAGGAVVGAGIALGAGSGALRSGRGSSTTTTTRREGGTSGRMQRELDSFLGDTRAQTGAGRQRQRDRDGGTDTSLMDELSAELSRMETGTRIRDARQRAEDATTQRRLQEGRRQERGDSPQTVSRPETTTVSRPESQSVSPGFRPDETGPSVSQPGFSRRQTDIDLSPRESQLAAQLGRETPTIDLRLATDRVPRDALDTRGGLDLTGRGQAQATDGQVSPFGVEEMTGRLEDAQAPQAQLGEPGILGGDGLAALDSDLGTDAGTRSGQRSRGRQRNRTRSRQDQRSRSDQDQSEMVQGSLMIEGLERLGSQQAVEAVGRQQGRQRNQARTRQRVRTRSRTAARTRGRTRTRARTRTRSRTGRSRFDVDLDDIDGDVGEDGVGFAGADIENPTRTLDEADALVTEIGTDTGSFDSVADDLGGMDDGVFDDGPP